MIPEMQSPAGQGGASRELLGGRSRYLRTGPDWRAQVIATRYNVPTSLARIIGAELFPEPAHDH